MDLTYILLYLTVLSLWLPKVKRLSLWHILLLLATAVGLVRSYLSWPALLPIALLALAVFLVKKWRPAGILLLIVTAIGLGAHLFPGFHNAKVIDNIQYSPDGIPFTLYLNFDKTLIGIFILGHLQTLIGTTKAWFEVLKWVATRGVLIILLIAVFSLVLGFVRIDPKIPDSLSIWAITNLLFVCVAEEAFFRGFIQQGLSEKFGIRVALPVASLLFGVAHFAGGIKYVILASLAGAGYGWIYAKTRHIEASILTHFMLNLFHFLVLTYPALTGSI